MSLYEAPDRFSFPSGHAAASLSLALPLPDAGFRAGVILAGLLAGRRLSALSIYVISIYARHIEEQGAHRDLREMGGALGREKAKGAEG